MDLYGDFKKRDKVNAFVQLLWEKGSLYERDVITGVCTENLNPDVVVMKSAKDCM